MDWINLIAKSKLIISFSKLLLCRNVGPVFSDQEVIFQMPEIWIFIEISQFAY